MVGEIRMNDSLIVFSITVISLFGAVWVSEKIISTIINSIHRKG